MMKTLALIALIVVGAAYATGAYYSERRGVSIQTPLASQGGATGLGTISGVVLDDKEEPVPDATVYTRLVGRPINGSRPSVKTDKNGRFSLSHVSVGLNGVHAFKEADGYPDTFFAFYAVDPQALPLVTVYEKQITNVVVKLGPKAAKVAFLVRDADTNKPLEDVAIELRRPGDPAAYVSLSCIASETNGGCEILIPPMPCSIRVVSPGYRSQNVAARLGPRADVATLKSGEARQLTILMRHGVLPRKAG